MIYDISYIIYSSGAHTHTHVISHAHTTDALNGCIEQVHGPNSDSCPRVALLWVVAFLDMVQKQSVIGTYFIICLIVVSLRCDLKVSVCRFTVIGFK